MSAPENPIPEAPPDAPTTALAVAPPAKIVKKRGRPKGLTVRDEVPRARKSLEGFVPSDELKRLTWETDEACRDAWRAVRDVPRDELPFSVAQAVTRYEQKLSALVDRELDEEAAHRGE